MRGALNACCMCGVGITQREGPGRKRKYCSSGCRDRARRVNNGASPDVQPKRLGLHMAEGLPRMARELLAGEHAGEDLPTLLGRARELVRAVENYSAGAVLDARHRGTSWDGVARAAQISSQTARERWNESVTEHRLNRQLSERTSLSPTSPLPTTHSSAFRSSQSSLSEKASADRAARLLADALSFLHEASGLALRDVAVSLGMSSSYVSRILSGDRLPGWSVMQDMMACFGADAAILRHLWETSHGIAPSTRRPVTQAADRVFHALQGLYTAAGRPTPADVHRDCSGALSPSMVERVLDGTYLPDWPEVSALVAALNGCPEEVRPLWEEFHYAWLCTFEQSEEGVSNTPGRTDGNGELH